MTIRCKHLVWVFCLLAAHCWGKENETNLQSLPIDDLTDDLSENSSLAAETGFFDDDIWGQFYKGPVCELIDVYDFERFRDLENCTIVSGFVRILLLNQNGYSDNKITEFRTFPKLRVIVDYLLIYRVYGLKSIRQLFPNLVMIGGKNLLYQKYAMVIFENPDLTEIGLDNLRYIVKGSVRIQNNGNLCYLNTIDWTLLGKFHGNDKLKDTDVLDNNENCINQCSTREDGCLLESRDGIMRPYCWGLSRCQAKSCPSNCTNACRGSQCVCHHQCLGGCDSPNNASSCFACREKYYEGTCVNECPAHTLLINGWQCIYPKNCSNLWYVHHRHLCLKDCPAGHKKVGNQSKLTCVKCQGECNKICNLNNEPYEVTNLESLQKIHRCTVIKGQLILSLSGGASADVDNKLLDALGELQQVDSLVIRRSFPIVSLSFFRNLHKITGKKEHLYQQGDDKYSLFVLDNYNLKELWDLDRKGRKNFTIDGGKAFFHFNPHLCLDKINRISNLTAAIEDFTDISTTTNGDRIACDVEEMKIMSNRTWLGNLEITWQNPDIKDYRTLIGYHVYYKKSPKENATYSTGISACGESSWSIKDVDKGEQNDGTASNTSAFIKNLSPFTKYAFYVTTSTTSTAQTGAQSKIHYIVTPPDKPSVPRNVAVIAKNQSTIFVQWLPPEHPNGNITHYTIRWKQEVEHSLNMLREVDMCSQGAFLPKPEPPRPQPEDPGVSVSDNTCKCDGGGKTPGQQKTSVQDRIETQKFEDFLIDTLIESVIKTDVVTYVESVDVAAGLSGSKRKKRSANSSLAEDVTTAPSTTSPDTTTVPLDPKYMTRNVTAIYTNYTFTGLDHFSEYSFEIEACNHATVDGKPLCSFASISTRRTKKADSVDRIPGEIKYIEDPKKPQNRTLHWEPPPSPNGFIRFYTIEVERLSDENKQNKCCSAMFYMQRHYCELPGDLKKGEHRARVLPVSLAGPGDWSDYVSCPVSGQASQEAQTTMLWAALTVLAILVAAVGALFWWFKRRQSQNKHQIYASVNPEYSSIGVYEPDEYEIPAENIELLREIGHGHFGKVYEGLAKEVVMGQTETKVAVKTLHGNDTISKRMEFLKEASVMKAFNSHHVVRLLGVVSITSKPMVVMEYMDHGDLKTFLRSTRPDAEDKKEAPLTLQQKLQMCGEIADGMAYLSETKFVHRDLAARNCLVNAEMTVKIGDFGLTRDVYETDYYRIDSRGILPVRWMAPESLKDGVFDSRSDVWSYGIVLWEIATLAEQPYQGLQHDQVTRYVIDGGYMEQPKECPQKIYDLMLMCWHYSPSMRPTFSEIVSILSPDLSDNFREVSFYHERKEPGDERTNDDDALLSESVKTADNDMYSSLVATVDIHGDEGEFGDPQSTDLSAFRHLNGLHPKDFPAEQGEQANGKDDALRYVAEPGITHRKSSTIC